MAQLNPTTTTVVTEISDAINEGRHMDVIEFDAASHTGVDDIREILEKVPFRPSQLAYKVYIIDEVHMLSLNAYNALLKTIEEPPSHVVFILATTDTRKMPATVISRCQRFNFKRVPVNTMVARLRTICDAEGIETDDLALTLISRQATGALRDAVSLLDQLASSSSLRITADDVREALGATDATTVQTLVEAIVSRDAGTGMSAIQRALDQGADARQIAKQLVESLRTLIQLRLTKDGRSAGELSEAERASYSKVAERANGPALLHGIRAFSGAFNEMHSRTDAQLALEMALLECVVELDSAPSLAAAAVTARRGTVSAAPETIGKPQSGVGSIARGTSTTQQIPVRAGPPAEGYEGMQKNWKAIVQELSKSSKPVLGWLNSSKLHSVEGNVVYIRANHDMAFQQLSDMKKTQSIAAAINAVTGGHYSVQVFIGDHMVNETQEDPVLRAAKLLGGKVRE